MKSTMLTEQNPPSTIISIIALVLGVQVKYVAGSAGNEWMVGKVLRGAVPGAEEEGAGDEGTYKCMAIHASPCHPLI